LSEVYKGSTEFVHLDIYGDVADTPPTAAVKRGTTITPLTVQGPETVGDAQRWTAIIGFVHTQDVGEISVTWTFTIDDAQATKTDYLDVVVPLAEIGTIREELEIGDEISDEQIARAERRVRTIIQNATGQVFASYEGTYLGTELPDGSVRLPRRMLSLTSVSGVANQLYYALADTGWRLALLYPRKRDGFRAGGGEVPIVDPFAKFRSPGLVKVNVTGRWGYERVPQDITEAALILIEQQLCPDSLYRERYIKTMTAADMRFEFNPGAYAGTGNVIADQILAKYVQSSAAVI
jgi:hypothetical protein